ncbi:unnamed protein product [Lathyrus sativus]|nr:unnamed protein product [Lathyrus sativus]
MAMALRRFVMRGLDSYRKKYIEKDSIQPLYHVLYGGMISSYLIALPYERRRLGYEETDNVFRFAFLEVNDVPSWLAV